MSISKVFFSREHEEWGTPQDLFDRLDAEFHFTLDPCASIENHKCGAYFTIKQDGLLQEWAQDHSSVFMNPPYGKNISMWMQKARDEAKKGATVVCLVPSRTSTIWWHKHVERFASEVRFIKGKLKFNGHKNTAPFPSVIVIYRPEKILTPPPSSPLHPS